MNSIPLGLIFFFSIVTACAIEPYDDIKSEEEKTRSNNNQEATQDSNSEPTAANQSNTTPTGTGKNSVASIKALLLSGSYKTWLSEPEVHESSGPHGLVRTYINDTLATSMRANQQKHFIGSAAIKEIYAEDRTTIKAYAYEIKTSNDPAGNGWLWYESFASNNFDDPIFGQGLSTCTGCHSNGTDYVTTDFNVTN